MQKKPLSDIAIWLLIVMPASAAMFAALQLQSLSLLALVFGVAALECGVRGDARFPVVVANYFVVLLAAICSYVLVGFGLMYGTPIFEIYGQPADFLTEPYGPLVDLFLQTLLLSQAAILFVAGVQVAHPFRVGLQVVLAILFSGLIYPMFGRWNWGGGFLSLLEFQDFTGGTAVCETAGWATLGAVWILNRMPSPSQRSHEVAGESTPQRPSAWCLAIAGVLLWVVLAGASLFWMLLPTGEPDTIVLQIAVNANLSVAASLIVALTLSRPLFGAWRGTVIIGGIVVGAAACYSGIDSFSAEMSLLVGAVAAVLFVGAVYVAEKVLPRVNLSLPLALGVGGMWGSIATGLFSEYATVRTQVVGSLVALVWAGGVTALFMCVAILLSQVVRKGE